MCGVNGIADFASPVDEAERTIEGMNQALAHRGPDGEGKFISKDTCVVLGSRRLSIVDIRGGAMPIVVTHGDAEYAIVANAEFFNYKELKSELEKKYKFTTHSDTEVALFAYIEWGEECLARLRGQFAFAIYDGKKKCVFLARDRVGIKPLYYHFSGTRLIFSSEPKGVLASGLVSKRPDSISCALFTLGALSMGKCEPPQSSLFEGVHALPPASKALCDASGLRTSRYEDLYAGPRTGSVHEHAQALRSEVERAVLEQVPNEVPWGVLLSGGLDSSIILAEALRSGGPPAVVATIRYAGQENDDFHAARSLAEELGVSLQAPEISGTDIMASVDELVLSLDRPSDSSRNISLLTLYRTIAERGAKVALIGEGADEFNLGYYRTTFPGLSLAPEIGEDRVAFTAFLLSRSKNAADYFNPDCVNEHAVAEGVESLAQEYFDQRTFGERLDRMQYFYARQFLKGRLDMHDRAAMRSGVEARVPFCDEGVVAASLAVPHELQIADGGEKMVLREAFKGVLPENIRMRKKLPLPEAASIDAHRALLTAYERALEEAPPSSWDFLNKRFADELLQRGRGAIERLERGEQIPLGDGMDPARPLEFRMRHLFLMLTFLRWYDLYFIKHSLS